jgi:hypothetical protein
MNDKDVVKIARKIDRLNAKITDLVNEILVSDHPKAEEIVESLRDNTFDNPAWATHCVARFLDGWYCTKSWKLGVTKQKSKAITQE